MRGMRKVIFPISEKIVTPMLFIYSIENHFTV
jgi:hypothetical protein